MLLFALLRIFLILFQFLLFSSCSLMLLFVLLLVLLVLLLVVVVVLLLLLLLLVLLVVLLVVLLLLPSSFFLFLYSSLYASFLILEALFLFFEKVLVGAAVDLVGAAIRCGARGPDTFFLVIIGQALNAAVGPIVMAIPPKLSAVWFPPRQRTTATAISGLANILGTTVGFLMGLFVKNSADVLLLVYVQSGLSAFVALLIFIYFPAQPPSPPSPSSITTTSSSTSSTIFSSTTETEEEVANVNLSPGDKHNKKANEVITKGRKKMSLMRSLWKLLCNPNYVLLVLVGGLSGGIYNSWSALLGPLGYSQNEAAWLGAITTLAGIVSGVVVSKLADHIRHFKLILILMMAATALSLTWFTGMVNLHDRWHWLSDNFYLIATSVLLTGLFYNSTLPFFYEMAVEITYPVPEGTSSGILTLINNLGALVAIFSADYIAPKVMNWAITGSMATFAIVLIFLREQYKRDKYDNKITEGYLPIP
ncbi:MFS domain-containing protein [Balamuthia mandrillaris]